MRLIFTRTDADDPDRRHPPHDGRDRCPALPSGSPGDRCDLGGNQRSDGAALLFDAPFQFGDIEMLENQRLSGLQFGDIGGHGVDLGIHGVDLGVYRVDLGIHRVDLGVYIGNLTGDVSGQLLDRGKNFLGLIHSAVPHCAEQS